MTTRREFIKDSAGTMAGVLFAGCSLLDATPTLAQTKPPGRRREAIDGRQSEVGKR